MVRFMMSRGTTDRMRTSTSRPTLSASPSRTRGTHTSDPAARTSERERGRHTNAFFALALARARAGQQRDAPRGAPSLPVRLGSRDYIEFDAGRPSVRLALDIF